MTKRGKIIRVIYDICLNCWNLEGFFWKKVDRGLAERLWPYMMREKVEF